MQTREEVIDIIKNSLTISASIHDDGDLEISLSLDAEEIDCCYVDLQSYIKNTMESAS